MVKRSQIIKSIRKVLVQKTKSELKQIIVNFILEKKNISNFTLNKECTLCNDINDLQRHHLKPKVLGGGDNSNNLITLCKYCHWYLHSNPKFKVYHSDLVKIGMRKAKNVGKRGKDKKQRRTKGYFKFFEKPKLNKIQIKI